jgi:hypothetical protein
VFYLFDPRRRKLLPHAHEPLLRDDGRGEIIRNGEHQTLETLINEEALLFAKYLRGEIKDWIPWVSDNFQVKIVKIL